VQRNPSNLVVVSIVGFKLTLLDRDFNLYPGKMDHVTCVGVRIGSLPPNPYDSLQTVLADPIGSFVSFVLFILFLLTCP